MHRPRLCVNGTGCAVFPFGTSRGLFVCRSAVILSERCMFAGTTSDLTPRCGRLSLLETPPAVPDAGGGRGGGGARALHVRSPAGQLELQGGIGAYCDRCARCLCGEFLPVQWRASRRSPHQCGLPTDKGRRGPALRAVRHCPPPRLMRKASKLHGSAPDNLMYVTDCIGSFKRASVKGAGPPPPVG